MAELSLCCAQYLEERGFDKMSKQLAAQDKLTGQALSAKSAEIKASLGKPNLEKQGSSMIGGLEKPETPRQNPEDDEPDEPEEDGDPEEGMQDPNRASGGGYVATMSKV